MLSKMKFSPLISCTIFLCLFLDILIISDLPIFRQIFGFVILILLPGFLILSVLNIKLDYLEIFVLSWGISISFLMLCGLFLNNTLLYFGDENPLATRSLLIAFNSIFLILSVIGSRFVNEDFCNRLLFKRSVEILTLSTSEKAFLIIPSLFPILGVFGIHLMNTTNNNSLLFILLFLIPSYVIFICLYNQKFSSRLYPIIIYLISISLIILLPLRSNHIIGIDTHTEYYFFQVILNNSYWNAFSHATLDSTLSISLLPAVFQLLLNISPEFLFRILYPIIYSISPLIVYAFSKKYVDELYAFLSSCFFMFQWIFIWTEYNARTSLAVLFVSLAIFVLFNEKISSSKKRSLVLLFTLSCIISHYATTYIYFFLIASTFFIIQLLSTKYPLKKLLSSTYVVLFGVLIFLWYSLITDKAFISGVHFLRLIYISLNDFFTIESRSSTVLSVMGSNIGSKGIPHKIEFIFTWACLSLIVIGIASLMINYKKMSFPEIYIDKADFLKRKLEVTYSIFSILFAFMLFIMVAVPFVSQGYGMERLYGFSIVVLSLFFSIGAISLSKYFKIKPHLIILLVIIPYFLSVTGITYNIFDVHRSIILNSEGEQYDIYYVHDQESVGAKWLKKYSEYNIVYTDFWGERIMVSQAAYSYKLINMFDLLNDDQIYGIIFLNYNNIKHNVLKTGSITCNLNDCNSLLKSNFVYNNGGSEIHISQCSNLSTAELFNEK